MSSLDPVRGSRSNQPLIASWHRPRTWEKKAPPWRTHIRNCTVFCFLVFLASPIIQGAGEPAWTEVAIDRGVTVWSRDRLGRVLPELRARGQIYGEIFHAMAVILDNERAPEWVPNCTESREIKRLDARTTWVYSVTDSPWPVSDRDTVVEVVAEKIETNHRYRVLTRAQPDLLPLVEGRVRIPYSEIYFLLKRVDADSIEIEYGLDVDPGGALPKWMVRRTARNTLIDTILALEAQVARTRGQYQFEIKALAEELQ